MKPNLVSCDDAALEAMLLHDELAEPSEELLAHVESCHHCQQRISEIAGPIAFWQDVKDAISDTVSSDPQRSFTTIKWIPQKSTGPSRWPINCLLHPLIRRCWDDWGVMK